MLRMSDRENRQRCRDRDPAEGFVATANTSRPDSKGFQTSRHWHCLHRPPKVSLAGGIHCQKSRQSKKCRCGSEAGGQALTPEPPNVGSGAQIKGGEGLGRTRRLWEPCDLHSDDIEGLWTKRKEVRRVLGHRSTGAWSMCTAAVCCAWWWRQR